MYKNFVLPLAATFGTILAAPSSNPCYAADTYSRSVTITDQHQVYANAFVGGVSVSGGNSVNYNEGYSVGWTVTVGGSLGVTFDEVYAVGIDVSVSETTTTTTTEGASVQCPPGGWQCAALITPSFQQVDGLVEYSCSPVYSSNDPQAYTALLPIYDGNNVAVINVVSCACPDFPGSTDSGAPAVCPSPCGSA